MVNVPMSNLALRGKTLWRFSDEAVELAYHHAEETFPDDRRPGFEHRITDTVDLTVNRHSGYVVHVKKRMRRSDNGQAER